MESENDYWWIPDDNEAKQDQGNQKQ
eukprot:gene18674-24421_t